MASELEKGYARIDADKAFWRTHNEGMQALSRGLAPKPAPQQKPYGLWDAIGDAAAASAAAAAKRRQDEETKRKDEERLAGEAARSAAARRAQEEQFAEDDRQYEIDLAARLKAQQPPAPPPVPKLAPRPKPIPVTPKDPDNPPVYGVAADVKRTTRYLGDTPSPAPVYYEEPTGITLWKVLGFTGKALVFPFKMLFYGARMADEFLHDYYSDNRTAQAITAVLLAGGVAMVGIWIAEAPKKTPKITDAPLSDVFTQSSAAQLFVVKTAPELRNAPSMQERILGTIAKDSCLRIGNVTGSFTRVAGVTQDKQSISGYIPTEGLEKEAVRMSGPCIATLN